MNAFVTGSTGLLGSAVVRQLEAEGHAVKAMARSAEKAQRFLSDTSAEIVLGDMLNIPAFAADMADCDVLFHVAAYFKEYTGADEGAADKLQKINVDGTIELFEAAKAQGIRNIIYVSSSGVIGDVPQGQQATEQAPYNHDTANLYFQSKIRGEQAIDAWLSQHPDMRVILIRPGAIIGPGDNGPTGLGNMVISVLKGELPAMPPGGLQMVDVRDVAIAMVNAVEAGGNGERYNIVGDFAPLNSFIPAVAKAGGAKQPAFQLPYPMAWVFGAVSELVAAVTGQPPLATRVIMKTLNEGRLISAEKAKRELGVTFRPIADSINDSVAWFQQFDYV